MGIYNAKGENVVKKGIAGSSRFTYAIKWFEEANQFEEVDIQSVDLAIRGAKHLVKVSTTYPDALFNWYIAYLDGNFPFNKNVLLKKGYQWTLKGKELFHYSNYRVNPFISKKEVENIESLRDRELSKWAVASIGLPGVLSGGVYSNLMPRVSRLLQEGDIFSAGLDYGFKHDPMGVVLCSSQENIYGTVDILAELKIDNQSRFSHQQLAFRIIGWFKFQAEAEPRLKQGLRVVCDKSNPTYIEMLNFTAKLENIDWLRFVPSNQIEVLVRINFKQWLISSYMLNIGLNVKELFKELQVATWDLKASKPKLASGSPDHMTDALDYALTPWYNKLIKGVNPYWFAKETKLTQILTRGD